MPGIAWCRPPVMLALCSDSPLQTCRNASTLAPTTCAAARCMPSNTGLSSVPRPRSQVDVPGRRADLGHRLDQCRRRGRWRSGPRWPSGPAPSAAGRPAAPGPPASRMVRSTRTGRHRVVGPEVVLREGPVEDHRRRSVALHVVNLLSAVRGPGATWCVSRRSRPPGQETAERSPRGPRPTPPARESEAGRTARTAPPRAR